MGSRETGGDAGGDVEHAIDGKSPAVDQLAQRIAAHPTGLVLYELLTAEMPFQGSDRLAVAQQRLTSDPEPPSQVNPQIAPEVNAFVLSLLQRKPDDRLQSATQASEEISKLRRC